MGLNVYKIENMRDFGGLLCTDNRVVKDGYFFRGGPFYDTYDAEARKEVDDIGFKHVIDLRGRSELIDRPLFIPKGAIFEKNPAIAPFMAKHDNADTTDSPMIPFDELIRLYGVLPFSSPAYKKIMSYIVSGDLPIYMHCTAGKDRTGVICAIIQKMLNVTEEEIYRDYMLTLEAMEKRHPERALQEQEKPHREWLDITFRTINEKYGDFNNYLKCEFGIDDKLHQELINRYTKNK